MHKGTSREGRCGNCRSAPRTIREGFVRADAGDRGRFAIADVVRKGFAAGMFHVKHLFAMCGCAALCRERRGGIVGLGARSGDWRRGVMRRAANGAQGGAVRHARDARGSARGTRSVAREGNCGTARGMVNGAREAA